MMMNQSSNMGSMSDAMNGGQMPSGPLSPQYVNPSSMSPVAMSNMMGNPMANSGANMGNYGMLQEHMFPQSSTGGFNTGGLVRFAEGGMPQDPMAGAMPPEGGLAGQGQEGGDPQMQAMVEQIFAENLDSPEAIADALLQVVMEKIKESVSPEQMAQLQTPEGQEMLKAEIEEVMSQMGAGGGEQQGALGQMQEQAAGPGGGMPQEMMG